MSLRNLLERELALTESVVSKAEDSKKKAHGPTLDYFKGQAVAYKKVLSWLEIEKILPAPITIHRTIDLTFSWGWLALLVAGCILFLL